MFHAIQRLRVGSHVMANASLMILLLYNGSITSMMQPQTWRCAFIIFSLIILVLPHCVNCFLFFSMMLMGTCCILSLAKSHKFRIAVLTFALSSMMIPSILGCWLLLTFPALVFMLIPCLLATLLVCSKINALVCASIPRSFNGLY